MGNVYGYARVSTREQNLDRQMDALRERGIDAGSVFTDKATGAVTFEEHKIARPRSSPPTGDGKSSARRLRNG